MATKAKDEGYYFDLAKHMKDNNFSAYQLAKEAKVNTNMLNRVLAGKQPVSGYIIAKIVHALNWSQGFYSNSEKGRIEFETVFVPTNAVKTVSEPLVSDHSISGISPIEFAILSLTNACNWDNNGDEYAFRMLTSKDVYHFLPEISRMLDVSMSESIFEDVIAEFTKRTSNSFARSFSSPVPSIPVSFSGRSIDSALLGTPSWTEREAISINLKLKNLYQKGLIVDPILETVGTIAIATVGLVPTSFTKRTVEGDIVYRKISAVLWEYEMQLEEDKKMTRLHFRAEKIVGSLKQIVSVLNTQLNEQDSNNQ